MIHCDICDRSKSITISRHELSIEVFFLPLLNVQEEPNVRGRRGE